MASLIMPSPMNSTPSPAMMLPTFCTFLFFENMPIAIPAKANSGAIVPMSSATSCPVIVVPILAPMIIHTACLRVISPELTKPTTMTVVADEDWITAVMTAPTSTPSIRLEVSFSRIPFNRSPATASRLLLIICIPHRKSPSPPSSINTYSGFICDVPPDILSPCAFC